MEFILSASWRQTYPGAAIGVLALDNVVNLDKHPELEKQKLVLEEELRQSYGEGDRATLRSLPTLQAYHDYYKRFRKTYHVQLQLESIALKGKHIPRVSTLVEAMFMAELKNQLLTAGHDLATVAQPFSVHVASGEELYRRILGQEQRLKKDDMFIADHEGVLSSIVYGPDYRTQIKPETTEVVFTVYAPTGIDHATVDAHLNDIITYILLFSPDARVLSKQVYVADG
ncbi:MAG TPA: phenylalanine--tRNA ligase beta subunit-related protein [Anaerolineae bacterium]|nr:phenylalanine--tRNA ligase beta subunit-related protein [Anaerolineae bacterium]